MKNPNQSCISASQNNPHLHEVHANPPSTLPPINKIGVFSLSPSIPCPLKLHMTPSTFIQYLGHRKIMFLVMETLDESHSSVPLENREEETQNKRGKVMFKEDFRRLHIARPDVFYPKSRGSNTPSQ
jgi:hypothetical protein